MQETEAIELLESLGLTEYEAKSLYSLFKVGEAQAPDISRMAQVPKTRVYDVLERLMKKSLIVEVYGRPKKYRVIESNKAIQTLMELKRKELNVLEEKAMNLNEHLAQNDNSFNQTERVMKVKAKQDFEKILAEELLKAKSSVKGFTELEKNHFHIINSLKSASKNVEVKILSSKLENDVAKNLSGIGVEVKNFSHKLNAFIVDEKKVILALNDFNNANEFHFSIWHNNESLANALTHYFDSCWEKAE
ncbi:MAG: helix-turn-helix domain-containing protein [archaeon]|nr:helix-turn-helix domain-containing protein [archaeon]